MKRILLLLTAIIGYVACQKIVPVETVEPFPVFKECCPHLGKVMTLDLNSGQLENNYTLPGVSGLTIQTNSNPQYAKEKKCSHMADLKVTFQRLPKCWYGFNQCMDKPVCGNRMLKIELEIHTTSHGGFLYNVGDSATNNGWGGDSNTQVNDAEVMGLGSTTLVYSSDKCSAQLLETLSNILVGAKYLTLYVGNHFTRVQSRSASGTVLTDKQFCNECLFALNMQDDGCTLGSGNPLLCRNMDIYVGLNNMIQGTYRAGYGVCKARISWECCDTAHS